MAGCVSSRAESISLPFLLEGDRPAWKHGHHAGDQLQRIDEFVRPEQTVENWTELVTLQTLNKRAGLGSVNDHMAAHRRELVARCPGSTLEVIHPAPNGILYESSVVNCAQGADEGVVARILDGSSNRFIVQYSVRGPVTMTPERRAEWIEKLSAVEMFVD